MQAPHGLEVCLFDGLGEFSTWDVKRDYAHSRIVKGGGGWIDVTDALIERLDVRELIQRCLHEK